MICDLATFFTNITGVMSLTPYFSFTRLWTKELSWNQCPWGPGGGHRFVCLEILVLQQGCSSKGQILALSLCRLWQMQWLSAFFSYFFCQSIVDSVAFWYNPSSCCEDKGIEWRLLCQSLFGCIYHSLFHVVGRPLPGTFENMTAR